MADNPDQKAIDPTVRAVAQALGVPPDNPEADGEKGPPKLFLGKFKTEAEGTEAHHKLIHERKGHLSEIDRLKVENAQLKNGGGRDAPTPLDNIESEYDIPATKFEKAVEHVVNQRLAQIVEPALEGTKADQKMVEQYGAQYLKDQPDVLAFTQGNERIKDLVSIADAKGAPLLGKMYAYEAYLKEQADKEEKEGTEAERKRQEEISQSRPHAGIPGSGKRAVSRATGDEEGKLSERDVSRMVRKARQGDWREVDEKIFARFLPSEEELQAKLRSL